AMPWHRAAIVAVLLNIIPGTVMYGSVNHLTTGFVAICFAGTPMVAGIIRAFLGMEKFGALMVASSVAAVAGIYLMVHGSEIIAAQPVAMAGCIGGVISYATGYVILERWSEGGRAMVPVNLLSLLFLSPALVAPPFPSLSSVGIGVVLGIAVTGFGSLIFGHLVVAIGAEKAAYTDVIIGALALLLGGWFGHEPLTGYTLGGASFVLLAVLMRFVFPGSTKPMPGVVSSPEGIIA
ncbi:MAG: hypothetical protein ACP5O6_07530, partial [Candidatus Baltobacteraceae bacterium]